MVTDTRIEQGWNILSYIMTSGKPLLMRDLVDLLYRKYDYSKATARRILNRDILNGFLIKENLVTVHRKGKYSFIDLTGKGLAYTYELITSDKNIAIFYLESRYGLHGLLYLERVFNELYFKGKIEEVLEESPINIYSEEKNRIEKYLENLYYHGIDFNSEVSSIFSNKKEKMTLLEGVKYVISSMFSDFVSGVLGISYNYNTVLIGKTLLEIYEPDYIHNVLKKAMRHVKDVDKVTYSCINCLLLRELSNHAKGLWTFYILKSGRKFVSILNKKLNLMMEKTCSKSDTLLEKRIQERIEDFQFFIFQEA